MNLNFTALGKTFKISHKYWKFYVTGLVIYFILFMMLASNALGYFLGISAWFGAIILLILFMEFETTDQWRVKTKYGVLSNPLCRRIGNIVMGVIIVAYIVTWFF
jgi:Kef-type K+ transport system membrane component KefB